MKTKIEPTLLSLRSDSISRLFCCLFGALTLVLSLGTSARADVLFWDANGATAGTGGTGTWTTTGTAWRLSSGTGTLQTWVNSGTNSANLAGTVGTVTVGAPITLGNLTVGTAGYTINGTATNRLTFSGTSVSITGTTGNTTINAPITTDAASTLTLVGPTGNSAIVLGASNTIGGSVIVAANGKAVVSNNNALLGTTGVTVQAGGAIGLGTSTNISISGVSVILTGGRNVNTAGGSNLQGNAATDGTSGWSGSITLAADSSIGARAGIFKVSGNIGESVAGSKLYINPNTDVYGNNVVELSGSNTFTGGVVIGTGTTGSKLKLGSTGALNSTAGLENSVTFAAGSFGGLQLNGNSVTIANLSTNATPGTTFVENGVASGTATLTVGNSQNLSGTYAGTIRSGSAGALALTKASTGTLTLSGSNTYTGATNVNNGTLNVNGSINGSSNVSVNGGALNINGSLGAAVPVSVAAGATLGGSGVVSGTATILDGGLVTAGFNGAGNLTIGNLVFSGSGAVNVSGNGGVVGSALNVTTLLDTGTGTGSIAINVSNPLGWTNGTPYELITWSSIAGTGTSKFTVGSVLNATPRQTSAISFSSGTSAVITFAGDNPKWTGAQSNAWTTAIVGGSSNWVLISGTTPTDYISGDVVLFDDSATNKTVNVSDANVTPTGVTFNNSVSNDYTLESSGGFGIAGTTTLTKDGGGTLIITNSNSYTGVTNIDSNGTLQIGNGTTDGSIASSAAININNFLGTLTYNLSGSQSYANPITGAGFLKKEGAGTLTLSGSNSYGGTIINSGTLIAASANALGVGAVTNDATLDLAVTGTYTGLSTSLTGTGTVNVTLGAGSATTYLNGDYSGFAGTWNIGVTGTGGKVQMNGPDNAGATVNVLPNATIYVTSGGTHNAALKLGGGDTGESLGQLRVGTTALEWAGPVTLAGTVTGSNDYTVGGTAGTTISGAIGETGGAQSLIKGGANTLILTNSNNYSGGTRITAGTVSVSVTENLGTAAAGLVFDGGTLQITGTALTSVSGFGHAVSYNSDKSVGYNIADAANIFTVDQTMNQGIGGLTKSGSGTLALTGSNTFTGDTTISAGALQVSGGSAIPDSGTVSLASNSSVFEVLSSETIGVLRTSSTSFTSSETKLASGATLTLVLGSSNTYYGKITGNGGLTLTSSGVNTVTLRGTNTYSGDTTINGADSSNQARLSIETTSSALSPNTTVYTTGFGQLNLVVAGTYNNNFNISGAGNLEPAGSYQIGAIRLAGDTLNGTITLSGSSRIGDFTTGANTDTLTGQITGNYALDFLGSNGAANASHTFVVSNTSNDWGGDTTLINRAHGAAPAANSGTTTLRLGASNVLPDGAGKGNIVFASAGASQQTVLDLAGFNETINGLAVTGSASGAVIQNSLVSSTSTLNVGAGDTTSSFSGTMRDNGGVLALTKSGTGTLTLTASNSYSGLTRVSAGTLAFDVSETLTGGLNIETSGTAVLTAHTGGPSSVKVLDISSLTISGTSPFVGGGGKDAGLAALGSLASPAPVPEPGTIGLLAVGAIGGLLLRRRNRKRTVR